MKKIKILLTVLLLFIITVRVCAQDTFKISGKVLSTLNDPIEQALITVQDSLNTFTDKNGRFEIEVKGTSGRFSVVAAGYNPYDQMWRGSSELIIKMIPVNQYRYNESLVLPSRLNDVNRVEHTSAVNLNKKDFVLGAQKIDQELVGQIAGLQVIRNSGMPGEGSYLNFRGIHSLVAENMPLIVVNGMPYMPDRHSSTLFNGYTRDLFQAYNLNDIQNITVLKGAEAAMYGSLGSNGVILIETDGAASNSLETQISYYGSFGMNWNNKRIPMLERGDAYTSYITDIGMARYHNMTNVMSDFPFLSNPKHYLYDNNIDWQDEIYTTGITTDHLFRVEGGDAIAKYDLSLGFASNEGTLKNTKQDRYHTLLNASVQVSRKVDIFATVGLAYINGVYQDQGMIQETNPILAAYASSPLLTPHEKQSDGSFLRAYRSCWFGTANRTVHKEMRVSNPVAILNTLDERNRQYDLNLRAGINYRPLQNLTLTGSLGIYYNYNNEHVFIPGASAGSIIPISDGYGEAVNQVKEGVAETKNYYFNLNSRYFRTFAGKHDLDATLGAHILMTQNEYDAGLGRNTGDDIYQVLGNSERDSRTIIGYLEKWNWMNFYGHIDYTYDDKVKAAVNLAYDASSSVGKDATRFNLYPSVGLTWLGKGWSFMQNAPWVNTLNIRAEYSLTGNSRFASTYGRYYYTTQRFDGVSGIVRANVPNTSMKPERTAQLNAGFDWTMFNNRVSVSFDYYNQQVSDILLHAQSSAIYGSALFYSNAGKMENQGVELAVQATVLRTHDFEWIVGGNIARNRSKIKSLGGYSELIDSYDDEVQLINRVGESPFQFYGFQTEGVFASQEEADAAHLVNTGNSQFNAGDVRFVDQNGDHCIDADDRISLGSASPDFFGGFFTNIRYKGFALSAEFNYSKGNKAYNAVRRTLESSSRTDNQSIRVTNRWTMEGQITDMPRASWLDPMQNNTFSDRWIEDASFLRMRHITLSYSFDKPVLKFFRSGTIYVTGENLWTLTDYLGLDPEFAYGSTTDLQGFDNAKLVQPKTVKFGVNLKF